MGVALPVFATECHNSSLATTGKSISSSLSDVPRAQKGVSQPRSVQTFEARNLIEPRFKRLYAFSYAALTCQEFVSAASVKLWAAL